MKLWSSFATSARCVGDQVFRERHHDCLLILLFLSLIGGSPFSSFGWWTFVSVPGYEYLMRYKQKPTIRMQKDMLQTPSIRWFKVTRHLWKNIGIID